MPYEPMSNNEKRARLQGILEEVEEDTNLEGLAVVTWDGIRIASASSPHIDADEYSAASAALISLGDITVKRMNEGRLIQVVVRGDSGYTILTRAGTETLIVAVGREQFKFGFFLNLMVRTAYKVAEVLAAPVIEIPGDQPLIEYTLPIESLQEPIQPETPTFIPSSTPKPEPVSAKPPVPSTPAPTEPFSPVQPAPSTQPTPVGAPSTTDPPSFTPQTSTPHPVGTPSPKPPIPSTVTGPSFGASSLKNQTPINKEDERKAILEALKAIGMIGEEPTDN